MAWVYIYLFILFIVPVLTHFIKLYNHDIQCQVKYDHWLINNTPKKILGCKGS